MPAALEMWTISKLALQFGVDRRTLERALSETEPAQIKGRNKYFTLKDAVSALLGRDGLDLTAEKARANKGLADKYELENEVRRKNLVPGDDVTEHWSQMIANCRALLLAVPAKISKGNKTLEKRIKGLIYEALEELSNSGVPDAGRNVLEEGLRGVETAARPDDKPVGRPRKASKQRV